MNSEIETLYQYEELEIQYLLQSIRDFHLSLLCSSVEIKNISESTIIKKGSKNKIIMETLNSVMKEIKDFTINHKLEPFEIRE